VPAVGLDISCDLPDVLVADNLALASLEELQLRFQIGDLPQQVGFLGCDIR
jgi:hypothetical protein